MIVGYEVYVDGKKVPTPKSVDEAYRVCRERGGMAWIGLYEPTEKEFESIVAEFGLHPLAVEDAIEAHQRPKIERYGRDLFMVLKTAAYSDGEETVDFGEIHLYVGEDFVVTVRHGKYNPIKDLRQELESTPALLARGPFVVLYAVMDRVLDGYGPVLDGLENDIDEVETEVFGEDVGTEVSRRIYGLSRQVIRLHRVTNPLAEALDRIATERRFKSEYNLAKEVIRYLRDAHDHSLRVNDRVDSLREVISNILNVNLAIISKNQNDQTKRISAWAAILVVPTVVTGIYGMNFDYMPELAWPLGYPFALVLILTIAGALYLLFRRRGWL